MSVFLTSLQNVLPIILIIVLGYVLRKINWLNETFAGQASKLIMNVALPSSIFVAVLKKLVSQSAAPAWSLGAYRSD